MTQIRVDVVTDEVRKLLEFLDGIPESALPALLEAVDEGNQVIIGLAQKERFRGKGPFPMSQRRLGVVTGTLRKSLAATAPRVNGTAEVSTSMGSGVSYFGIHEFGFSGNVSVKAHTRRMQALGGKEQVVKVRAHSRRLELQARAPLGAAIDDHSERVYGQTFGEKFGQLIDAQ